MIASASGTLAFARCAGFAFRAPGFSHPSVPPPVRAGLALFLTLAIGPAAASARAAPDGLAFVIAIVSEFLLGMLLGMAASAAYDGAYAGGRAIDDYVGVKAMAPSAQLVAPSGFGRVWSIAFTGGFFLLGVYRPTVAAFAASFARLPVGTPFDAHAWLPYVERVVTTVAVVGAGVAAPAIALAFVVHVALGALSRAVPRFGNVTLAFPLAVAAALIATVLSLAAR
ncbi:MAG: flagellar biosynthetic protein FliR [Candidatus Eremiobacteraeota bacterium]|nr:flagellar biosynthetic protein FliR [Candidatus Eremiobacteraeota bacterium]MBV8284395.1 flagellar biosynthetic protein FliR [Candidatus Eremiobacteraeota bacterium]MBV8435422.1 flagellar biosynthetic protein FliR [Candidatus Eremiobacteraeota bacterium]MBV8582421.1 flagellar biosynthetic protein FliR [Candidatus Eremiobacteraeota bacterium]